MIQGILQRLLCIGLLLPVALTAGENESHERIRETAGKYVLEQYRDSGAKVGIEVGRLDRRLRLPRCDGALEAFSPARKATGARRTVGVRCSGTQGWSLYVPVKISLRRKILVASREIDRGSPLTAGDFRLEERDVAALSRGYLEDPSRLLGKVSKRALHRGQVITPGQLSTGKVIRRGHQVTILGRVGGIKVRMQGKALSDAGIGEHIRVQNSSSKRRIDATVVAPGIVEVAL